MFRSVYTCPKTVYLLKTCPFSPYLGEFIHTLREAGYSRNSMQKQLSVVRDLGVWLLQNKLILKDVDDHIIEEFIRHRKRRLVSFAPSGKDPALTLLLAQLRSQGVIPTPMQKAKIGERESRIRQFGDYLIRERGFSETTLRNYVGFVDCFLSERFKKNSIQLNKLHPSDVTGFVQRHAWDGSHGRAGLMVSALRSYLRFLRVQGEINRDLAACVPAVASWRLTALPKFMEPDQVKLLLSQSDRKSAKGRRDHAIFLLLSRLGLRAREVVGLTLDDIDWSRGEITINGKGSREARFPLPHDVGKGLASYIKYGRRTCSSRKVFIRSKAPYEGFRNSCTICTLVSRAITRAGIDVPHKGSHVLRHTVATQLLRRGASLAEVGEILRHRQVDTTAIYAKVDLKTLRELAKPWPIKSGGAR